MTAAQRLQVGIVGGGAVATALAHELGQAQARCDVLVWARHPGALERSLKDGSTAARVTDDLAEVAARATVLVAVSDDAIGAVAEMLRDARPAAAGPSIVLHTSGASTGASALAALKVAGIVRGSVHPLAAVGRASTAPGRFTGMPFVVEAEEADGADGAEGTERAKEIVARLGGEVVLLPSSPDEAANARTKARYHAAATMVATGVVALVDRAARELAGTDEERTAFRSAFARLAASAAANVMERDGAEILTGPIARGDSSTLDLHADVLAGASIESLYGAIRGAAEAMLRDARSAGDAGE